MSQYSWALYHDGNLSRASQMLGRLRSKRDRPNDRTLLVNIAICSGNWDSLLPFIESEWVNRTDREPQELLRAGQLATQLGSPRAKELVVEAARTGSNDPGVLLGCYGAAVKGSWEETEQVHEWLQSAADLSDPEGPIQKISFDEIAERKPNWEKREEHVWELLISGGAPLFSAANALNRTVIDLFLAPALSGASESDLRRRPFIPAFSGARAPRTIEASSLTVEPNSLLILSFLGILERVIGHFERILIPHATMGWLFEEIQRVEFHQPSRVSGARALRQLLDDRRLGRFEASVAPEIDLVREVGNDLASLISEAEADRGGKARPGIVVRPYPVHRVGSLMLETTELTDHAQVLCGCADVVRALRRHGRLTAREEELSLAYLKLLERPWPHEVSIADGSVLYLDGLALSYLQQLNLLDKLGAAGFTALVSPNDLKEMHDLIRHGEFTGRTLSLLNDLRRTVAGAIADGKIKVGQAVAFEEEAKEVLKHPTAAVLRIGATTDAILVDDRFINEHQSIEYAGQSRPIINSLELLDLLTLRGELSASERNEARTKLRNAGFGLIPVEPTELESALQAASVENGLVVESAELRAIRESILKTRMTNVLQIPKELPWLTGCHNAVRDLLTSQWKAGFSVDVARARSEWLAKLVDPRGWSHRMPGSRAGDLRTMHYRQHLLALIAAVPTDQPPAVLRAYAAWLNESIVKEIAETDPENMSWLIETAKEMIDRLIHLLSQDGDIEDEN